MRITSYLAVTTLCTFALIVSPPLTDRVEAQEVILSTPTGSELSDAISRFTTDLASVEHMFGVRHSPARTGRLQSLYVETLTRLSLVKFGSLSRAGQVDYLLFNNHLLHEQAKLEDDDRKFREAVVLVPFVPDLLDLEVNRRRMEIPDPEKTAAALDSLKKRVVDERKRLETALDLKKITWKQTTANRAASILEEVLGHVRHWFGYFQGYDPLFSWWCEQPYRGLEQSLKDYETFIKEKLVGIKPDDKTTIIGDPIGREALMAELKFAMIPYTPDELVEIANKEFAWCDAEMRKASRELGFGDDWKKALEHVKELHEPPGRQPAMIRELALEAIDFVEKNNLVTVPQLAKDTWRMEMMSPERQLLNPFFLGGDTIIVSYPTNTMTQEQKRMSMRGNNRHFARATVHHELIPGHHLQGFMEDRYRTYRRIFSTPFFTEGWALHWELLLWDLGFPKTPENRIGMLFWRMHRCARIIFSLGFHMEKMTPQQCVDFLVDRVGHERENALAEVRRSFQGGYSPLYQAAYMLGGFQLRALNKQLVGTGKMSHKQFHDAVLQQNNIPIDMVRAALTNSPLLQNYVPSWRFADQ